MESNHVHRQNVNPVDTQLADLSHSTQDLEIHKFKAKCDAVVTRGEIPHDLRSSIIYCWTGYLEWNLKWVTLSCNQEMNPNTSSSWYVPMISRWRNNSLHRMSGTLKGVYRKVTDTESCTYEARLPKYNGPAQALFLLERLKHATPLTTLHSTDITLSNSRVKVRTI